MNFMKVLFLILFCFYSLAQSQQDNDSIKVEIEEITLQEVVDTALSNNYDLRAFKYEVSTLEKIKIQAGLIPNPEIEFEAENILGSKELRRIDNGEFTLLGSQLFELGGKRSSRVNLVENQVLSAQSQYELLKIDVIANVKSAFFDLYKTQSQIELQKKFIQINEEILKTISERVKAGRTSPAEESKVKIALVNSRIEFDRLQRLFNTFQNNLNALLGISGQNLMPKSELFENIPEPTDLNKLINEIEKFPSLQLLYKEKQVREAQLTLEQSQAIPDLTINGGIRYLNEIKANSFVVGASIPLPFFDRNQGNIQAAEVQINQMDAIIKARILALSSSLNGAYNNLLSAYNNSKQLKENIIPESEKAYEVTKQGYLQGRFAFIDLLDAQRTLFETQTQYLLELSDYYNSLIELENITGKTFITK